MSQYLNRCSHYGKIHTKLVHFRNAKYFYLFYKIRQLRVIFSIVLMSLIYMENNRHLWKNASATDILFNWIVYFTLDLVNLNSLECAASCGNWQNIDFYHYDHYTS